MAFLKWGEALCEVRVRSRELRKVKSKTRPRNLLSTRIPRVIYEIMSINLTPKGRISGFDPSDCGAREQTTTRGVEFFAPLVEATRGPGGTCRSGSIVGE